MDVVLDRFDTALGHVEYALLAKDNFKRTVFLIIKDGHQCKEFVIQPGDAMKYSPEALTDFNCYDDELIVDGVRQRFQRSNEYVFRNILNNNDTIFVYAYNP
ncbi:hypothetical protein BGX24_011681, partial [Mortierella sp. AD032]